MSKIKNLQNFLKTSESNVDVLKLAYSIRTDVWHTKSTYIKDSLMETDFLHKIANFIVKFPKVKSLNSSFSLLDEMRFVGMLDDYKRGSYTFETYVTQALLDNYHDLENLGCFEDELITYDHKRGMLRLTALVTMEQNDFLNLSANDENLFCGWKIAISFTDGTELAIWENI